MKKKYFLISFSLVLVELFNIINFSTGFYCNLNLLKTNKETFYIDENIIINASWELNYDINDEIAYIQVQIFDKHNEILWNSSECNEIGTFEKNWTIEIARLNISFTNYSNVLYIKFYSYYFHFDAMNTVATFLETIKIKIFKRFISCQLIGFKNYLKFNEELLFQARFYDELLEENSNLINQSVIFKIISNDLIRYESHFVTNESGTIKVFILSIKHLKPGRNLLIFLIKDNKIYNNSKFIYEIFLEKNPIFIEIIKFKERLSLEEDLEIRLFYYFYFNDSLKPLDNQHIELKILRNNSLIFTNEYKTDNSGVLHIIIVQELFNSNQRSEELIIDLTFNGTDFLENKTLSLKLKTNQYLNSEITSSINLKLLSLTSILTLLLILILFIVKINKNKSEKILSEIAIRY